MYTPPRFALSRLLTLPDNNNADAAWSETTLLELSQQPKPVILFAVSRHEHFPALLGNLYSAWSGFTDSTVVALTYVGESQECHSWQPALLPALRVLYRGVVAEQDCGVTCVKPARLVGVMRKYEDIAAKYPAEPPAHKSAEPADVRPAKEDFSFTVGPGEVVVNGNVIATQLQLESPQKVVSATYQKTLRVQLATDGEARLYVKERKCQTCGHETPYGERPNSIIAPADVRLTSEQMQALFGFLPKKGKRFEM